MLLVILDVWHSFRARFQGNIPLDGHVVNEVFPMIFPLEGCLPKNGRGIRDTMVGDITSEVEVICMSIYSTMH